MSAETRRDLVAAASSSRGRRQWLRARARLAWRFLTARFSSSLTRRIVVLNLGGLVVLMIGFLLLNQFRADIIAARVQSLTTQADIISAAIAGSAAVDTDTITIDPDKLLQLAPGQSVAPSPSDEDAIQFSINPERVGPVLHRLVTPTHTRARIFDSDGRLLLDSRVAFGARRGRPLRSARYRRAPRPPGPANRRVCGISLARRRRRGRTAPGSSTGRGCRRSPPHCRAGRNPPFASTMKARRSSRWQCRSNT